MKSYKILVVTTLLCLNLMSIGIYGKEPSTKIIKADIIFENGNIYTVNEKQPNAEAIAIKKGTIIFVGSNQDVQKYKSNNTKIIDVKGNTLVPGLTDSHCHLAGIGKRELELNLEGTTSLEDFLTKIKSRISQSKPGEWIIGRGWIETFWNPSIFPTREDLDQVAPNNPVFLWRADGHGVVVNSKTLTIAKINRDTPNPFGGEIVKNKKTSEPNGMLLDNASLLIEPYLPKETTDYIEKALIEGVTRSLALGWSELQIAGNSINEISLLEKLYKAKKIKLRIYDAINGPSQDSKNLLHNGASIGKFNQQLTTRTIKVHFDGALGSKGAALLEPYSDYNTSGFLKYKEEDLMPMFLEALRKGIQIETHAIGDRANRTILDWYEKAFVQVPIKERKVSNPRWRVEHAQIINPTDIDRFAKLGVIASMQPSHAIGDLHFAPSRLGKERLKGAYAWQSLIKSGTIIAGGTDAPVERGEPMIEFYAAVARKDLKGFSADYWHSEEAVSREQALKIFTIWPAYAAFEENIKGSIECGKLADFTILSQDIMKIPETEIPKTFCVMTVVNGEVVFERK